MKKTIFSFLLALLLCVSLPTVAFALEELPGEDLLLQDEAGLLSSGEALMLQGKLAQLSREYNVHICVATRSSSFSFGLGMDTLIETLYDHNGYGYGSDKDGVLLLICMDVREYRILSKGAAADAISPNAIDQISDAIVSDLSDGDYLDAFDTFADQCAYYLDGHINGFPFDAGKSLLIALAIGLIAAFIVTAILKGQLKSVRRQSQANVYVKPGSMRLTQSGDYFMYRNVSRTAKPKSSSSSHSSGSSRNIGGGMF